MARCEVFKYIYICIILVELLEIVDVSNGVFDTTCSKFVFIFCYHHRDATADFVVILGSLICISFCGLTGAICSHPLQIQTLWTLNANHSYRLPFYLGFS